MEGILLTGFIVPFLVSVAAGVVTDHALFDFVDELRKKGKKKMNHDLQRAVKRSFLSALDDIIRNCQIELRKTGSRKYPIVNIQEYPGEVRKELEWLGRKSGELKKELGKVGRADHVETIFESLDEIEALLIPAGGFAYEKVQVFEQKLVAEALKGDNLPECYKENVRKYLFELMCDRFSTEIKYTPEVYNIFTATILPQINQTLLQTQGQIQKGFQNIEALLNPFWTEFRKSQERLEQRLENIEKKIQPPAYQREIKVGLDTDFEEFSDMELFEMQEKINSVIKGRLLRAEQGSIVLVFEGTEEGAEELERLFQSGELGKMLGVPVRDVRIRKSLLQKTAPLPVSLLALLPFFVGLIATRSNMMRGGYRGEDSHSGDIPDLFNDGNIISLPVEFDEKGNLIFAPVTGDESTDKKLELVKQEILEKEECFVGGWCKVADNDVEQIDMDAYSKGYSLPGRNYEFVTVGLTTDPHYDTLEKALSEEELSEKEASQIVWLVYTPK